MFLSFVSFLGNICCCLAVIQTSISSCSSKLFQENDTRELLATVSEVTLDNGFLREQVSIRDEQVLRLSRQVQDLQVSYYTFQDTA